MVLGCSTSTVAVVVASWPVVKAAVYSMLRAPWHAQSPVLVQLWSLGPVKVWGRRLTPLRLSEAGNAGFIQLLLLADSEVGTQPTIAFVRLLYSSAVQHSGKALR